MNQKADKLQNQFEDSREETTEVSQLFHGISIHVNGLTGIFNHNNRMQID